MNGGGGGGFPYYTNPYSQPQPPQQQPARNPYAAPPRAAAAAAAHQQQERSSLDSALSTLERSGASNPQHLQAHLQTLLQQQPQPNSNNSKNWSVSQVLRFIEWILSTIKVLRNTEKNKERNINNEQTLILIWNALTQLVRDQWSQTDDKLIYAAVTLASDNVMDDSLQQHPQPRQRRTLLSVLMEQAAPRSPQRQDGAEALTTLQCGALSALAPLWTALERIQTPHAELRTAFDCSNGGGGGDQQVWWLTEYKNNNKNENDPSWMIASVGNAALQGLGMRSDEWQSLHSSSNITSSSSTSTTTGLCEFQTSCAAILTHLLQYGGNVNEGPQQQPQWPTRKLLQEAARLNDANMPGSAYTLCSLQCLRLLVTLQLHWHGAVASSTMDPQQTITNDDLKRFLQSTPIVAHLARVVTSTTETAIADIGGPRWTQPPIRNAATVQAALAVLQTLYRASPATTGHAVSQPACTRQFLTHCWRALLVTPPQHSNSHNHSPPQQALSNQQLDRLIFLHTACRTLARETLKEAAAAAQDQQQQQPGAEITSSLEEACRRVLTTLLDWARQQHSLPAVTLLKELLADKIDAARHDELSRCLWKAAVVGMQQQQQQLSPPSLSSFSSEQCLKLIVELSSSNASLLLADYHRPVLLGLLDVAYQLVRSDATACHSVLAGLSADTVEALVQVMSPKQVRVVVNGVGDASILLDADQSRNLMMDDDSADSTPPAHNLSRLDDASIMGGTTTIEEERVSRGMDPAVRVAAATLLAVLGNRASELQQQEEEQPPASSSSIALLRRRMVDSAMSFVSDLQLSFSAPAVTAAPLSSDGTHKSIDSGPPVSLDMTRRRLRLLTMLATPDNEEYLASLIHSSDAAQRTVTADLERRLERSQEALQEYRDKEQRLTAERDGYSARLVAQSVLFQREKSELQRSMSRNAQQSAEIHATERQKAERRARELSTHMAQAQQTAQECREAESQARQSLETATAQLEQVSAREQDLARRTERSESELQRVSGELGSTKAALNDVSAKEKDMRQCLADQQEHVADMEESEGQMRDSLDNAFGDMASLARLYEIKEKEVSTLRESGEDQLERLKRQLQAERQRSKQLEEQEQRTQYDYEVLTKKYTRAKEKLEKEREERRKADDMTHRRQQRTGGASAGGGGSYFNQLHTVDRSRGGGGKENTSSSTSRSRGSSRR